MDIKLPKMKGIVGDCFNGAIQGVLGEIFKFERATGFGTSKERDVLKDSMFIGYMFAGLTGSC